jgi:hypothetical protein
MRPANGATERRFGWLAWAVVLGLGVEACSRGEAGVPILEGTFNRAADAGVSAPDAPNADGSAPDPDADGPEADAEPNDYDAPESYLAVESIIRTSCAFVRCHGGPVQGGAGLWFGATTSVRRPLVNVPSCEYDKMMRVKPGDVANSWVITKLEAPQDPETHFISFSPQSDWVPNSCPGLVPTDAGEGRFGFRMPETGMYQLDPDSIAKVVAWIEAGAPGPD